MQDIAAKGRMGDDTIAHVGTGELMIPPALQTPELMAMFAQVAQQAGVDPARFVVGSGQNSTNPATGKFEFGLGNGPGENDGSGGQGNDGGAGPGGPGSPGRGDPGNHGGFGPDGPGADGYRSGPPKSQAELSSDPMVRAIQMKSYPAAMAFAMNKVFNPMMGPVGLLGNLGNMLGAEQNANPDGSLGSFGGRTGAGDSEGGGLSLAKRMLR